MAGPSPANQGAALYQFELRLKVQNRTSGCIPADSKVAPIAVIG